MSTRREFLAHTAATVVMTAAAHGAFAQPTSAKTALMTKHRIPQTDLMASRLSYGCAMVGLNAPGADLKTLTISMIQTAYGQGINFFDLADVYGAGEAERAMGEALKQSPSLRAQLVIQSKCGYTKQGTIDNSHAYIARSVEDSLGRMGTDYLDILLLHAADLLVEPEEVAQTFDELHRSGKVRYFGVSNHSQDQIDVLLKSVRQPIIANQILLGLLSWSKSDDGRPSNQRAETVNYCRAHNIQVQAHSPLRASYAARPSVLNPAKDAKPNVRKAANLLTDIAQRHDATPAAVMLAWLLRHPAGIVPILGGSKREHLIENCTADRIELSRDEWYALLSACSALDAA